VRLHARGELLIGAAGLVLIAAGLASMVYQPAPGPGSPSASGPGSAAPIVIGSLPPTIKASHSAGRIASSRAQGSPEHGTRAYATRIVIPALDIDLPVVRPPAGSAFPLCNVAMYLPSLAQPGEPGATYIYAHARIGMFLPILTASQANNGQSMIGMLVQVYTSDDRYHLYVVTEVRRHARTLADAKAATAQELWLQTSEGPSGAFPKVQLVAVPLTAGRTSPADAHPTAQPTVCS
jgi:hypothetical protein